MSGRCRNKDAPWDRGGKWNTACSAVVGFEQYVLVASVASLLANQLGGTNRCGSHKTNPDKLED